jgi:hypothetical protein
MATFFEKLFHMPTRIVKVGSAKAQSHIAFPFSGNPVELSEFRFDRLTDLATNKLGETVQALAESIGFDATQVNHYTFWVIVEKTARLKWFLQSFRINGKNPDLVEVIGLVDEMGIREGVMALEPCRIIRDNVLVWANGVQGVPPFDNNGIAQLVYYYGHHKFSWEGHNEAANIARQSAAEYHIKPTPPGYN